MEEDLMNITKNVLKIMEDNVGKFLSRPSFEWQSDGTSILFRFSDARTLREVEGYIQNMRGGIICKPWFPDGNLGGDDPFVGGYTLQATWTDKEGNPLKNGKKAIQFIIAKWKMIEQEGSSRGTEKSTTPNAFEYESFTK
jgi:hypothetical protein